MLEYFIIFIGIGFIVSVIVDQSDSVPTESIFGIFILISIVWAIVSGLVWGFAAFGELSLGFLLYIILQKILTFIFENMHWFIIGGLVILFSGMYINSEYPEFFKTKNQPHYNVYDQNRFNFSKIKYNTSYSNDYDCDYIAKHGPDTSSEESWYVDNCM